MTVFTLVSIIYMLLWAGSQLLCTTLFSALRGWKTKVAFNLGDSVTSAELQGWAPWCLSMAQRASAPSQTHPCSNAQAAELGPWSCHPASPTPLTFFLLCSQLLDWDYGVLFCSLYLILSVYFIAGFHPWYFGLWESFTLHIREETSSLHMHEGNFI